MYEMIDNNPFYKVFWLLLVGVALAFALWIIRRYILAIAQNRRHQQIIKRWEFRVLTFVWTGYASWALYHLIKVNFMITLVIIGILIVAGWRSWMEFYSGMLLRLERRIKVGDTIHTAHGAGKVLHYHFQSLAILTDEGEIIHVPFSKVTGEVIAQRTDQSQLMAQSFSVKWKSENVQQAKDKLWILVFSCPWTAALHPIQVTHTDSDNFRITAKTIDNDAFHKLESYVRNRVKE